MARKRFDMRLDDDDRADLELIRIGHRGVSMSKIFKFGLALVCQRLGIRDASVEDLLKKK